MSLICRSGFILFFCAWFLSSLPGLYALESGQSFPLWPDGAPGAVGKEDQDIPTLTPFLPAPGKSTGAAVIVCPGGGYRGLADYEGKPVAEWLSSIGVTGFVLKYRLGLRYQ